MSRAAVRDDDALVGRGCREHHRVLVQPVLRQRRDALRAREGGAQRGERQRARHRMRAQQPQLVAEHPQRPDRHGRVHQPEQQPRADQPQLRHQHQRKRDRDRQRAQVVEREHLRHQILERDVALEDAHHERNLQPHQHADGHDQAVEQRAERGRHVTIGQEQQRRHGTAHQRDHQFDAQEMRGQLPLEKAREPRTHAHGEEVAADDGGELQHRVAQQVRRQRTGGQLVHQPAGRHHEHRGEQRHRHGSWRRGECVRTELVEVHGRNPKPFDRLRVNGSLASRAPPPRR